MKEKAGLVVGFGFTLKVCEGEREMREGEDGDEVRLGRECDHFTPQLQKYPSTIFAITVRLLFFGAGSTVKIWSFV